MTRRDSPIGGSNYSSRPPSQHIDTPQHQRQPPTQPAVVCDDTSLPRDMRDAVSTVIPPRTQWIRECYSIQRNVNGIQGFVGNYIATNGHRALIRPGSLLLVCHGQPYALGDDHVLAYIYLPEDIWYTISGAALVRATGWHRPMQSRVQSWASMTRMQRVATACADATTELQGMFCSERDADRIAAGAAIAQLNGITDRIRNSVSNHRSFTADTIRGLFTNWLQTVALTTANTPEVVMQVIGRQIASVLSPTVNLAITATTVPDEEQLSNLRGADLTHIWGLLTSLSDRVRAERERRSLVLSVVHYLESRMIRPRSAVEMIALITDRGVSDMIIQRNGAGLNRKLGDVHRIFLTPNTIESIFRWLQTNAVADTSTPAQAIAATPTTIQTEAERPATENRRIRNIHINRRNRDD